LAKSSDENHTKKSKITLFFAKQNHHNNIEADTVVQRVGARLGREATSRVSRAGGVPTRGLHGLHDLPSRAGHLGDPLLHVLCCYLG
jgi:hypothetical protein